MKRLNIYVMGKVQGVWYRKNTQIKARTLGLKGNVRNLADGSVYIEVEGEENKLNIFLQWCRKGPEKAIVRDVKTENGEVAHFRDFVIIR